MDVTGVVSRPIPSVSGGGIDAQTHRSVFRPCIVGSSIDAGARFTGERRITGRRNFRVSVKPRNFSGFCDDGHLEYYSSAVRCGGGGGVKVKEKEKELSSKEKKMKKRLKLLKGLSEDMSMFSEMGFRLDPDHGLADQDKGKMISEAAEMLLAQLKLLKAEKKEMKRRNKEEKAKLKALLMQSKLVCKEDSSSSSESSDDECGEIVDMGRCKNDALTLTIPNQESTVTIPSSLPQMVTTIEAVQSNAFVQGGNMTEETGFEIHSPHISVQKCRSTENFTSISNACDNLGCSEGTNLVTGASMRKIEVCMGGKCKKSGAALLMEEFQKAVGGEGSVVGCKCLGKCRSAPNVKVLNSIDGIQAEVIDDSVRPPANPLCIGVGLEDVGTIVSKFFGGNQKDLGLAPAS